MQSGLQVCVVFCGHVVLCFSNVLDLQPNPSSRGLGHFSEGCLTWFSVSTNQEYHLFLSKEEW